MNAQELYTKGGKPTGVYYCGKCNMLNPLGTCKEKAEECCRPKLCECGKPIEKYRTTCGECSAKHYAKVERERLEKAELVDAVPDGCMLWENDNFYDDVGDYLDQLEDPEDRRKFLYIAPFRPVCLRCAADLLECPTDGHHEDIMDHMPDVPELDAAIEKANALFAEKRWGSYFPDSKRKIRVPARD